MFYISTFYVYVAQIVICESFFKLNKQYNRINLKLINKQTNSLSIVRRFCSKVAIIKPNLVFQINADSATFVGSIKIHLYTFKHIRASIFRTYMLKNRSY